MPLRPSLLAALVALIWGINFVVIDAGLDGVPPLLFLAMRFTVVLVPAVFFIQRPAAPWRDVAVVGLFMSLGQFALLYVALAVGMPPGLAALVLQTQVLLTVLIAALRLHESPTGRQVAGLLIGGAGLVVVSLGRAETTPGLGLVLTLAAALSWAIGNVAARKVGAGSGLSMTVWSAAVVPLPLLAMSLVLDGPATVGHALTHLSGSAVLSTLYTAYLSSLVGYGIWNTLLSRYPAAAVVPFALLVPPVGLVAAWLVQQEVPNAAEATGGVVLLVGVLVAMTGPRHRQAVMASPALPEDGPVPSSRSRSETRSDTAPRNRTVLSPTWRSSK